ncbi:MAG: hypothetical protein EZS28_001007 [Streblomastix strix]|uniref:Uncharacterized protein n=1 Tax=Streblomastix strix TaxID=222440 RepID=A0A5J4X8I4_9EUKA|nr:MAG: hypothetical protein EZS28_001007 [Streblomastix strix]
MSSEVQSTGEQRSETNSQTIKHVTIEKVSKRKYTRKAKTDNAAKELVDQMIKASEEKQSNEMMNTVNEIVNELIDVSTTNEIVNEPVNEQLDLTKQQSSLTQKRIIPRFWVKWYPQIDAPQNTRNASTKKSGAIARELMDKMIEEQEKSKTNETHDEQDNKLLDDLLSKFVNETPRRVIPEFFVKWYPVIDVPSDLKNICTYYSTKINDFTFDGSDAFNEYITPDKYCHPYFDFDHIESLDQYESVLKWLDSIDGYSNDAQISTAYNLKFIEHAEKKVSIHVVFYEKRILQADMMELVKMTANQDVKRFAYEINEFVDDSVYKLKSASKNTRQMFRHILPNKCFRGKSSVLIAGKLCKQDDEPFNQIVQCIQDESDVSDVITNWPLVIHKVPSLKEKEKHETNSKRLADVDNGLVKVGADGKIITKSKVKNGKIDDIDYDDNFIVFSKNQMRSLLKKFETTFENLQKTTASLRYSPHSEEFIKEFEKTPLGGSRTHYLQSIDHKSILLSQERQNY